MELVAGGGSSLEAWGCGPVMRAEGHRWFWVTGPESSGLHLQNVHAPSELAARMSFFLASLLLGRPSCSGETSWSQQMVGGRPGVGAEGILQGARAQWQQACGGFLLSHSFGAPGGSQCCRGGHTSCWGGV